MVETEKSAGFIVFRLENSTRKYLLLHKPASEHYKESWGFPKGWVEKAEDLLTTAKRETVEEAGISDLQVFPEFKETVKFFYKREGKLVAKYVTYFLGKTENAQAKVSFEHAGFDWLPYDEASKRLTSKSDREVLRKAEEFLKKPKSDLNKFFK